MSNPTSTTNNDNTDFLNHATQDGTDSELDYAALSDALEQTMFESFDDGIYIGMMSGTSLDGMDAVLCQFSASNLSTPMQLLATYSQDFPPRLREVLLALCHPNGVNDLIAQNNEPDSRPNSDLNSELDWLGWASHAYSEFASTVVNSLLQQSNTDAESILAIGCHGQTVRHRPQMGFTLQLLDPNIIAERTGISVVSDFRRRDMAVGGQGAPLVPAFHRALFATPNSTRILLNLGGIANITVLPATSDEVIGYDTGPANLLLDAWSALHTGKDYDAGGAWAQSGQVIEPLLNQLLAHPFFTRPYPKSTGREDFNLAWLQDELQAFDQTAPNTRYSSADLQATLTELTAISACDQINKFIEHGEDSSIYVCGGGALNDYLMTRLQAHLPHRTIASTAELGLEPTWVEAAAFAWLARQTLMGASGNLPAVTGASKNVVLGQVCFA
ncbi:anhydro-N-acetylmuramic acid kinase [uncultured Psychrobacter sp.]|uniref:anhydro-N-acetylmuramic acid kinase n=1 Tax=uncultured Psychrobacter sp. TaxID=259303 RepID=UPI0034575791